MKGMREKPYCSGVSQERLEGVRVEYIRKLCGRVEILHSTWRQYGENSLFWEKAWADFTFSITTLFDGNDPKAMRLVLEEVIGEMDPGYIMNRLQSLLEQDAAWVDEDTLDQESMDEEEYASGSEEDRQSSPLTSTTLFAGIEIDHATKQRRDARGGQVHEIGFEDIKGSAVLKRTVPSVTPEKGQKEKKTIRSEEPVAKRRKTGDCDSNPSMVWDLSKEISANMVTPEDKVKKGGRQREIDLSHIPPLVFPN